MVRGILIFLITCAIVYTAIEGFRVLSGKQRWALTKSIGYSLLIASTATAILAAVVFIF